MLNQILLPILLMISLTAPSSVFAKHSPKDESPRVKEVGFTYERSESGLSCHIVRIYSDESRRAGINVPIEKCLVVERVERAARLRSDLQTERSVGDDTQINVQSAN